MTFPNWAPASVIKLLQERTQQDEKEFAWSVAFYRNLQDKGDLSPDYNPEDIARMDRESAIDFSGMLRRLATDERMEWVWVRMAKLAKTIKKGSGAPIDEIFARQAELGYFGPTGRIGKMTKVEYRKWVSDVEEASLHLARLVKDTGLDEYLLRDFKRAETTVLVRSALADGILGKDCHCSKWSKFFEPPSLSSLLNRLSGEVEKAEQRGMFGIPRELPRIASPRADHARRQFFIQTLTGFCQRELGSPQRRIVAIVTSVAFEQEITERQVIRLAPAP